MHRFDAEGNSVVLYDAHGLSSIDFTTGKVRIERDMSGAWFSANGGVALVHNDRKNGRFARTVPDFKPIRLSDGYDIKYTQLAMLSDGERGAKFSGNTLELLTITSAEKTTLTVEPGTRLEFTLGPRLDPFVEWETRLFVGSDDSFVACANDGTVYGGQLVGKEIEKPWSAKCGFPQGIVSSKPHGDGTFIAAFHPALARSNVVFIQGKKVVSRELATISPATFSGEYWVFQPSRSEIIRLALDGTEERFTLPEEFHGAGELMAHGERLLIVHADRERIFDVIDETEIERRVAPSLANVRTALRGYEQRFNDVARPANLVITLAAIDLPQYGIQHRPRFTWDHGDVGFLRAAAIANVVHTLRTEENGRWSLGSYSNPLSLRPIDAKELKRDFAVLDEHELDFLNVIFMMQHPLQECFGGSFNRNEKVKTKKVMEPEALALFLNAVVARVAAGKRIPLAKVPTKALTPEEFVKKLDPQCTESGWFESQTSIAWVLLAAFGEDVLPVFIDWFATRPSSMVRANAHIIGEAAKRMTLQYPKTKKPFLAAIEVATKRASGEDAQFLAHFATSFV